MQYRSILGLSVMAPPYKSGLFGRIKPTRSPRRMGLLVVLSYLDDLSSTSNYIIPTLMSSAAYIQLLLSLTFYSGIQPDGTNY